MRSRPNQDLKGGQQILSWRQNWADKANSPDYIPGRRSSLAIQSPHHCFHDCLNYIYYYRPGIADRAFNYRGWRALVRVQALSITSTQQYAHSCPPLHRMHTVFPSPTNSETDSLRSARRKLCFYDLSFISYSRPYVQLQSSQQLTLLSTVLVSSKGGVGVFQYYVLTQS